jgi:hypothetical protein
MQRRTVAIIDAVTELADLDLVSDVRAELRVYPAVPLFKLYVINAQEVFFGYYPIQEHRLTLDGEASAIWDLMGKDTILFHHTTDGDEDSMEAQYVRQSRMWFDSVWSTVAREPKL